MNSLTLLTVRYGVYKDMTVFWRSYLTFLKTSSHKNKVSGEIYRHYLRNTTNNFEINSLLPFLPYLHYDDLILKCISLMFVWVFIRIKFVSISHRWTWPKSPNKLSHHMRFPSPSVRLLSIDDLASHFSYNVGFKISTDYHSKLQKRDSQ